MRGSKQVVDVLNDVLAAELLAVGQYFMHSKLNRNRGFMRLADVLQRESNDEMSHAGRVTERILFLEGTPEPRMKDNPKVGQTVTEQMQNDLALEHRAVKRLNEGIAIARQQGDNASAELFTRILTDEEEHIAWIQTQLFLIEKLGESTYLQSQLTSGGDAGTAAPTGAAATGG